MPWNEHYYPPSMEQLVRRKAIEIANALLEEGQDEGTAIRIARSLRQRSGLSGVVCCNLRSLKRSSLQMTP